MISLGVPLCLMHTSLPNDKIKHHYVTDCVHEKKNTQVWTTFCRFDCLSWYKTDAWNQKEIDNNYDDMAGSFGKN